MANTTAGAIKPKLTKLQKNPNPDLLSGFYDSISIALDADIITYPTAPKYAANMTGVQRLTAIAAIPASPFGTDAVWVEFDTNVDGVNANTKAKSNYSDSKASVSMIEAMFEAEKNSWAQASLLKGQQVHVVLRKAGTGEMKWYGRAGRPAIVKGVEVIEGPEKDTIKVEIEFTPYEPLYLPDTAVLNYAS